MVFNPLNYYPNYAKRFFDLIISLGGIIFFSPLMIIIGILIKITSPGSIIFKQKRVGKHGKEFTIYKFRTMVENAERLKTKVLFLNEADGPVFKIRNDPRFTKVGKFLSHTGLDELPQLLNVFRGEMGLVGPRPLPAEEEAKIPLKTQKIRRSVKPGLVSSWIIKGAHQLTFKEWMLSDIEDIKSSSLSYNLKIFLQGVVIGIKLLIKESASKTKYLTPFNNLEES